MAQARLALRDRAGILRTCGLMLGLHVCGFYIRVLTGDPLVFHWGNRLRFCSEFLYSLLHDLLCGRGGKSEDEQSTKKFGRVRFGADVKALAFGPLFVHEPEYGVGGNGMLGDAAGNLQYGSAQI